MTSIAITVQEVPTGIHIDQAVLVEGTSLEIAIMILIQEAVKVVESQILSYSDSAEIVEQAKVREAVQAHLKRHGAIDIRQLLKAAGYDVE